MEFNRRAVLGLGIAGILFGAETMTGWRPSDASARARRPNILWILSEDNNPSLGCYGDRVAHTPRLDRLASRGSRFETAYCTSPVCAPSRFSLLTGVHAEAAGPAHHHRAVARMPGGFVGFPQLLREAGYYCTNNAKTDYNADVDLAATWDESGGSAHWRNRPAGVPFFAQITLMTTHESMLFRDTPPATSPEVVRVPPQLPDCPEIRQDLARYYDATEAMDAQVGAILDQLDEDGVADDTIVFYFGDNGGSVAGSKRFLNDRGLRVPLIIAFGENWRRWAPGPPGRAITTPVSQIDLPVTTLALAGIAAPGHMHGQRIAGEAPQWRRYVFGQRGRMDERYDLQRAVRDERYLYVRNYLPHRPYGQYVAYQWRAAGYQAWERRHLEGTLTPVQDRFWQDKPYEELYDLRTDPDGVYNLADIATHATALARLRTALDEHMLAVNDNGLLPEGSPIEGYRESRRPGAYPLRRIMTTARLAARREPANLRRLLNRLTDRDPTVRYWAAQGMLGLGAHASGSAERLARRFAVERDVNVRTVLAETLARLGVPDDAVAFLAATVARAGDRGVRLRAIDALTHVGDHARPYRSDIADAASSSDGLVRDAARYLLLVLDGEYTPETPVWDLSAAA